VQLLLVLSPESGEQALEVAVEEQLHVEGSVPLLNVEIMLVHELGEERPEQLSHQPETGAFEEEVELGREGRLLH